MKTFIQKGSTLLLALSFFYPLNAQNVRDKINNNDKKVAIYTQNGAEILDLAAPLEVLSHAGFEIYTVGLKEKELLSQRSLRFIPTYDLQNAPDPDILIFVGGNVQKESDNAKLQAWIKTKAQGAEKVMSICTGAFFLAKTGLLDGKEATTFHSALDYLEKEFPKVKVNREARVVEDGNIITTAGISAGIDGSLHLLSVILGADVADKVAEHIEYIHWNANQVQVVE